MNHKVSIFLVLLVSSWNMMSMMMIIWVKGLSVVFSSSSSCFSVNHSFRKINWIRSKGYRIISILSVVMMFVWFLPFIFSPLVLMTRFNFISNIRCGCRWRKRRKRSSLVSFCLCYDLLVKTFFLPWLLCKRAVYRSVLNYFQLIPVREKDGMRKNEKQETREKWEGGSVTVCD